MLSNHPVALLSIILLKLWPKVREVVDDQPLIFSLKIKVRHRHNMVNLPDNTMIVPLHSALELLLDMTACMIDVAPKVINRPSCFARFTSTADPCNMVAKLRFDLIVRIVLQRMVSIIRV